MLLKVIMAENIIKWLDDVLTQADKNELMNRY
jgi:hypothetical protein